MTNQSLTRFQRREFEPLFKYPWRMPCAFKRVFRIEANKFFVSDDFDSAFASSNGIAYLAGRAEKATQWLPEILNDAGIYRILFDDPSAEFRLLEALGKRCRISARETFYLPEPGITVSVATHPDDGIEIRPIDLSVAKRLNKDLADACISMPLFGSPEGFIQTGFGSVVLLQGKILSAATTADIIDDVAEVQINTTPSARRRGYAQLAAASFIKQCWARSIDISWDSSNEPSALLAKKLGLLSRGKYHAVTIIR